MDINQTEASSSDEIIEAKLRYVTFRSRESDFAICSMDRLDRKEAITAIGPLGAFHAGDRLTLVGRFETHGKYGLQFRVQLASPVPPEDQEAIREYLINAKIKGVGPKRIDTLLDIFGDDTLTVITQTPEKLDQVPGLGKSRIKALKATVQSQTNRQEVMIFLYELKLSAVVAARVWAQYQEQSRSIIEENPYRLIDDVDFFTFEIADAIAQRLNWKRDSIERAQASLHDQLKRAYEDGHICLPKDELIGYSTRQVGSIDKVKEALVLQLNTHHLCERISNQVSYIYQSEMEQIEAEVTREIITKIDQTCKTLKYILSDIESQCSINLADAQAKALEMASKESLLLLTGGPGTGKTTTVKTLLALYESHKLDVQLAAPTGRAARRLSETTNKEAKTIHRLLDYQPLEEEFRRGIDLPLETDVILIDEMSMVDLKLFVALMRAVPKRARLILVGDANQLPSVGPGRVYHDLLVSQTVPTVTLTHIFRQAQESHIVSNAYHILNGLPLQTPPLDPLPDFFEINARSNGHAADLIEQLIVERIPDRFGIKPNQIQVITPMYRGHCGADQINKRLQSLLNPSGKVVRPHSNLRVGDRVMQLKNFYDKDVYNGDMGIIITRYDGGIVVDFGGRVVNYSKENLNMLTLAYACSIHKSQGSEYPAVIIPVVEEHWSMLQRDLLYTAVTRGQKLVILLTMPNALRRAIMNQASHHRFTLLNARLGRLISETPPL